MKKALIGLLLLNAIGLQTYSSDRIEIFGYFETQYMGASLKNHWIQLYSNKLRLDLKSDLSPNIRLTANFNAVTYHGKTEWNILDFLSPGITSQIPVSQRDFYAMTFANRYILDNANVRLTFGRFDLTAGKQQISPGSGYAWNPTDLFNFKDLLDPTYEQPGHNAVRLDFSVGGDHRFTAVFSPEQSWRDTTKMLEWKGRLSHFDLTIAAAEKKWPYHDYSKFDFTQMNFSAVPERRRMLGGSLAGELFGTGLWAEWGFNWMEYQENFYELLLGMDYTFDFQTYVMVEFYRNTRAAFDDSRYSLNDWMRWIAAEIRTMTRDQAYLYVQHPVTDLIQVGVTGITSLSDSSWALVPTLRATMSDDVEIFAYLNFYFGREGTAFSRDLGSGGIVRLRVYF